MKSKDNYYTSIDTTIGDIKRYLQNQQLIYIDGQYHLVDISKVNLDWDKVSYLTKLLDLNSVVSTETQLVFNFQA